MARKIYLLLYLETAQRCAWKRTDTVPHAATLFRLRTDRSAARTRLSFGEWRQGLVCLILLAALSAATAFGDAISVNGLCEVGTCASPDILTNGNSISSPFSFIYTFANTDRYQVSGNFAATDSG